MGDKPTRPGLAQTTHHQRKKDPRYLQSVGAEKRGKGSLKCICEHPPQGALQHAIQSPIIIPPLPLEECFVVMSFSYARSGALVPRASGLALSPESLGEKFVVVDT